jgi:hypothetical protein
MRILVMTMGLLPAACWIANKILMCCWRQDVTDTVLGITSADFD